MKPVSSGEWVEVAERSLLAYSERTGTPVEEIELPEALSSPDLEVIREQPGVALEAHLGLLYGTAEAAKDAFVRGVEVLGITAGSLAGRAFALKLPDAAMKSLGAWFQVEPSSVGASSPLSPDELKKLVDEVASLNTEERPGIPNGSEFENVFRPENQDVVYGRSDRRMDYIGRIPRQSTLSKLLSEHWVTIDQYNNESMLKVEKFESPEKVLGNVDELVKDHPKVKAYWDELKKNPRFSPVTVFTADKAKLEREGGAELTFFTGQDPDDYNQHMLAIRRACKFGVDYIVNFTEGRVHFVLDGVDDVDVVTKASVNPMLMAHSPITGSELRSIYRNWDTVKHRVVFYRRGVTVDPPWETNKRLWETYRTHREDKHEASAMGAASALVTRANELHESGAVSEAVLTECMFHLMGQVKELMNRGRHRDAISLMKQSTELLDRLEREDASG